MDVKTVRLPPEMVRELDKVAKEEGKRESETMREIIHQGLQEYRSRKAVEKYLRGTFSQGRAASYAGMTLQEFHQELKRRGHTLRISRDEVARELAEI